MAFTPPDGCVMRSSVSSMCASADTLEPLVLLVAPAGYGKSTVMSQLFTSLEGQKNDVCWLSLDENDDDSTRFVQCLIEAMSGSIDGFGAELRTIMGIEMGFPVNAIARMFLEELTEFGKPVTIFLDDFHYIASESIHLLIKMLTKYCRNLLRIVIASRTDIPIGLGDLRSKGLVREIGVNELSLSLPEIREMIERKGFQDLDEKTIESVCARSEGWAVGIQLLCLAANGASDPESIFKNFTGRDRNIADYLGDMVLDNLSEDERKFILFTSILERMNSALCELILPEFNGQVFLEKLEALGLFLLPLDRERKWFRYHHLFTEFLRTRLDRDFPQTASKLLANTARWYAANGDVEDAIKYGLDAKDFEFSARYIASYARELVQMRGVHSTFLRWLNILPEKYKDMWPEIKVGYAWSLTFTHQHALAENELDQLEALGHLSTDVDTVSFDSRQIKQTCEMIRCVIDALSDRYDKCASRSQAWLEAWPEATDFNKGTVCNAYSYACNALQNFDQGLEIITEAKVAFRRCRSSYGVGWATAIEGMLLISAGSFSKAKKLLEDDLETALNTTGAYSQVVSILSLFLSDILYEKGDLTGARHYVEQGWPALKEVASLEFLLVGYTVSAKLMSAQGDDISALSLLDEGRNFGLVHKIPRLCLSLAYEGYTLMLRLGQLDQAEQYARNSGLAQLKLDALGYEGQIANRARTRLLIARGENKKALDLINPLLESFRNQGCNRLLMTGLALKSSILLNLGIVNEAMRYMEQAVEIGAGENVHQRFFDDALFIKPAMTKFLKSRYAITASISNIPTEYIQNLYKVFNITDEVEAGFRNETPIEALTKKEIRILLLIEQGLTNRQIAETLFVSEKTVKWHLHNVFGKLDVRNRAKAVMSARHLSLL